jgi:hypothetical protein
LLLIAEAKLELLNNRIPQDSNLESTNDFCPDPALSLCCLITKTNLEGYIGYYLMNKMHVLQCVKIILQYKKRTDGYTTPKTTTVPLQVNLSFPRTCESV